MHFALYMTTSLQMPGNGIGSVIRSGSLGLMCLNAWPSASDSIRRYNLTVIGVDLLEELCH